MTPASDTNTDTRPKLENVMLELRGMIDAELDLLLPSSDLIPTKVHEAIRWSVFAGGKRFRPILVMLTGKALGAPNAQLIRTAAAFELMHTYSLIHDDLPAMDDDELRRGVPTCHVRFDEATAILAGDALQTLAFRTVVQDTSLDERTRVRLVEEIAIAAGTPEGMVAGQALDIEGESREVAAIELEQIHRRKTGALITAAGRSGAIIAAASERDLKSVTEFASCLGLLFQITDDLLDVTATIEELGKTPGKDARSSKATYPGLHGVDQSTKAAVDAHHAALSALKKIDRPTDVLRKIADYILNRTA